ncbi:MAG: undecaprenyldiphospho-muramoylpentapeptide beta-N-acetylglucosaminyltransferase [Candidatus Adiutrix sp.]
MRPLRIIMAAASTGGHLMPALSWAQNILKTHPDTQFLFVGKGHPLEAKILPPEIFKMVAIKSAGLKNVSILNKIKALFYAACGLWQVKKIIDDFKPDLCLTTGGYVTVSVGLAAYLAKVPLAIHEQNARPGLANRVLGKLARTIMVGINEAAAFFPASKVVFTGNPVRDEIMVLNGHKRNFENEVFTVLVTGGSQGAKILNQFAQLALISLKNIKIIHQTGAHDLACITQKYEQAKVNFIAQDFFENMTTIYEQAHVAITRGGALTLAELKAAKLPAIIVPLKTAADDHQTINALTVEKRGAAFVLAEKDLSPESLVSLLTQLLKNPNQLKTMSEKMAALAQRDSGAKMASCSLKLVSLKTS